MSEPEQKLLFDLPPGWKEHWQKMPAFHQEDLRPTQSIIVHFKTLDDRDTFSILVGQRISGLTRSIWYPKVEIASYINKQYVGVQKHVPKYSIYVISKGRWESRLTSKALEKIDVPYSIVVEPQEYENYAAVISPEKILVLPFSNLGQGSIPARNWVWEHAIATGAERHWILDDNINGFCRLFRNARIPAGDGTMFCAAEEFSDRYENVAEAGFNYRFFADARTEKPPFTLNTRIYSCILLRNDLPYRWRGRYNEDTDLSLRILRDGHCTVLFNAFLANKMATLTMKGGNTDELYKGDGRLKMAESLKEQHPDLVDITQKWGRPQHLINYKIFRKNKLILKKTSTISNENNNYGMVLKIDGTE